MAGKKSTFLSMVLTLLMVSLISATILGFVHSMTKEAIDVAKLKAQNEAIKSILPEYNELGASWKAAPEDGGDSLVFFPAFSSSQELVGVAVKTYSKNGFGGLIQIMVGFKPDGVISGYQVLEHKETPGLGSKMDTWFNNTAKAGQNIIGRNPGTAKLMVTKDGGEVDAITASTITSRAFLESIRKAYESFQAAAQHETEGPISHDEETEGGAL